jgi:PucR C-terminal helix-turn-helix domain/GGDEF-like domain
MLGERLRCRLHELQQAAFTRMSALADPAEVSDPCYLEGLRNAVATAIEYGLQAIELDDEQVPPIPQELLQQARMAARNDVSLDTVLRRYFAGYTLLTDFLLHEAEVSGLRGLDLQAVMRTPAALFDRLIATVTEEYAGEAEARLPSLEERKMARINALLEGELLETSEFEYDFAGHHLAAIAVGDGAEAAMRGMALALDRRLLLVRPEEDQVWIWLGGRRELAPADLRVALSRVPLAGLSLAFGEPSEGVTGWRLTHRQAKAALPIAIRTGKDVRYSEVALLASILQDDLLATSLREIYLRPLEQERDGGQGARQTLLAYFAAERNVSSTAARMGLSRRTIANRLRAIEGRLGQPLTVVGAELETILRLDGLTREKAHAGDA